MSPRTGRAVTDSGAGEWRARLLVLPALLLDDTDPGTPADWRDGLRLTGHFLARDAFGLRHRPLPQARDALYDRVVAMAHDSGPVTRTAHDSGPVARTADEDRNA